MIYEYYQKFQKTRDVFLPYPEIFRRSQGKTDEYVSIFGYDPNNIETGNLYGPMYYDLDREGELVTAYKEMRSLVGSLRYYGLTDLDFHVCSGFKGFHVVIHPQALGVCPSPDLPQVYKQIASWASYLISLDYVIYERRRLWRIVNTVNGKSGLFKIPVNPDLSLDEILQNAKTPQPIIPMRPHLNTKVTRWIGNARRELTLAEKRKQQHAIKMQTIRAVRGEPVWETYNREHTSDTLSLLLDAGWTEAYRRGDKVFLIRPGKQHGISATIGHVAPGVMYNFSSTAFPFEGRRAYSPFQVLAILRYGGDLSRAAKEISDRRAI